jgi:hypothetical protein
MSGMLLALMALLVFSGGIFGYTLKAIRVEREEIDLDERLSTYH